MVIEAFAWILGTVVAVVVGGWLFWEFVHKRAVLGRTDFSATIREMLSCYEPGASITFSSPRSEVRLRLTKLEPAEAPDVDLELWGKPITRHTEERLFDAFARLEISYRALESTFYERPRIRIRLPHEGVAEDLWGRVVDHALFSAGLSAGDRYSFDCQGSADLPALQDLHGRKRAGLE